MSNTSSKSLAREYAFKFLFHLQLEKNSDLVKELAESKDPVKALEEERVEFDDSYFEVDSEHPENQLPQGARSFSYKLINSCLSNYEGIKEELAASLRGWTISRLDKTDLNVLLLGLAELKYHDTPKKVVINEFIKLSKKYGNKDSYSFINGILDRYGTN